MHNSLSVEKQLAHRSNYRAERDYERIFQSAACACIVNRTDILHSC